MTTRELIDYCLTYPSAFEDYPFDEVTAVLKHQSNKKMFALIGERDEKTYINLKCDPMKADILRTLFTGVTPGYHMNKSHWNTVLADSDVPFAELCLMIQESFDLTKPKTRKKVSP